MNSETRYDAFTRTRSTWLMLALAAVLWVALSAWAFFATDFGAVSESGKASGQTELTQEQLRLQQLEAAQASRESEATEQARLAAEALAQSALEAEEQVRLEAQSKAAERRKIATEETRLAALKAKQLVEQESRRLAEAAEEARLAAEAAAEQARVAAEAEAAAEQARVEAEAEAAAEQARVAAEAEALAQVRLANEKARIEEEARRAAAAEASRIAALARQQRDNARGKARELMVLDELSLQMKFAANSVRLSSETERVLDDIFNVLYLRSEVPVLVSVASNEYDTTAKNGLLSRDRGRAIASYLINRGLEKERFQILIESGEDLSEGTYHVRVSAEEVR